MTDLNLLNNFFQSDRICKISKAITSTKTRYTLM